ncbi:beta/gamma crystallin-related protein [Bacillus cereus]|nr:beta/gamma crystallin-related protein [Bacillus thuringiensis]MEB9625864.1 beta/gamma crystallin-related protein [Bacillus cereus]
MEYIVFKEIGERIPGDKGEGIYLYADANYLGKSIKLQNNVTNLKDIGMNDMVSSMRIIGSYEVILYEHANYSGKSVTVRNDISEFRNINMHDNVSSIKIIGSNGAVVYENSNMNNE